MRVKRLDLFGFKSFSSKTTVQFEPGVTAVVGPNGSGKSNLVDAIRWVLGEHNPRDVRAPRLEDVIFNGTDHTAPLSMAEVSLTLENEQGLLPISFSEVTVTRRVYRSGESECFINQAPCRLRDIQELFLGTGLGGGAYAIIEQGHIDMILSSKPEERRVVFEEASGIAKYLTKRQETLRKLDEVEQHLVRISDIMAEVRRQLSLLERQAAKARQYQTQWEQLKTHELRLAADELRQGQQRYDELSRQVESLHAKQGELERERQRRFDELSACQSAVDRTQAQLHTRRTGVIEAAAQCEQHESQATLKAQWIEQLSAQQQQLAHECAQLEGRLVQLQHQRQALDEQRETLDTQQQEATAHQAQLAEQLTQVAQELAQAQQAIEAAKGEVFASAATAASQRNELTDVTLRLQTTDARRARVREQRATAQQRCEALQQRHQQAQQQRQSMEEQAAQAREQAAHAALALRQAHDAHQELLGRLHSTRERTLNQRAKAQLLEELWRRYEGFPEAVKMVLANPPEGVRGVLADVLDPQPGYEQALESALGSLASAIVVQDRQALARCQDIVAREQLDRVQCIVLADAPSAQSPQPRTSEVVGQVLESALGRLSQFVRHDPIYQPLVDWLISPWLVVDELRRAITTAQPTTERLVSQAGERWDGRSWQLRGRRAGDTVRVGRKSRWEQAAAELQTLERELTSLQEATQQAEARWQGRVAHEQQVRQQLEQLNATIAKSDGQLSQLAHELNRLQDERQAAAMEEDELTRQHEQLTQAQQAAQQAVAEAEAGQREREASLHQAQQRREAAAQRMQELRLTRAQLETTLQSQQAQLRSVQGRLEELQADDDRLAAQRQDKTTQAAATAERIATLTQEQATHRQQIETLQAEKARLATELEGVEQTLHEHERARDAVIPGLSAIERELAALTTTLQEQQRAATERSFQRTRLLDRLREVYHMEETTVLAEQANQPALSQEQRASLIEQVERLKQKLGAMGTVSLGSVEEYDELKKRQDFLHTQHQDLVKARDDLRASITQINRAARQQFRETFAKILQEFQQYFTRLFRGGEANLILLDEDDVLESGIDIVARPPGKRPQSITLLSGGERALTAIALLFALFKVRPSPFCILDEIDAPLDEANVDRFTAVLEEFLSLSQFILITHNKKTITKADSLYGVTMEQPGISKIVSVKLTKHKSPRPSAPAPAPVAA